MDWFNVFGLIFITVIMIPNIVFAVKCKDKFENKYKNRVAEVIEQIGRYGCFMFMIFNIPGTWLGFWSDESFAVYLIVDAALIVAYCAIWIICKNGCASFRALSLSLIPSAVFLFSGIMERSLLLTVSALLFAPTHVLISYKNR